MAKIWKYFDYVHKPYLPITSCYGKFLSDVLLYQSFSGTKFQKQFLLLVQKIRNVIGAWNTVWGVKYEKGKISWELYFYNYNKKNPDITVTNLFKVLSSGFKMPKFPNINIEEQPYFMFSLNFNEETFKSRQIKGVRLYTIAKGGGNSYYWNKDGCELENVYDFYSMPAETAQCHQKIKQSFVLAPHFSEFLKSDLISRLMSCGSICIANKRHKEGVYFSRINISQLLFFLKYFSYPSHVIKFMSNKERKLDHLLFDVGFDCSLGVNGIIFGKSSYYGIF